MNAKPLHAHCPVCKTAIPISPNIELEETVPCPECNTNLQVEKIAGQQVIVSEAEEEDETQE